MRSAGARSCAAGTRRTKLIRGAADAAVARASSSNARRRDRMFVFILRFDAGIRRIYTAARMQLNVTSEIGRLKSVLVHLPGREIDVMVPPMMTQLLFDDILYGQVAREEHRRFQQVIRFVANEVFDIEDLLEEVFEDDNTKRVILRDFAKRNRLPKRLASWLLEKRPSELAEILIGGI